MKSQLSFRFLFSSLVALASAGLVLEAADARPPAKKNPAASAEPRSKSNPAETKKSPAPASPADDDKPAEKRAPLKLATDTKPINRDAADRVSYAPVIKKTAASVVYVHSSKTVRGQDLSPLLNDPMLRRFFELPGSGGGSDEGFGNPGGGSRRGNRNNNNDGSGNGTAPRRNPRNRLPDQVQQGLGSGVVVSADGYILTNNHVVEGADELKVSIGESNKRYTAKLIGRDAFADIAVLKIEPSAPLTPAVLGDSDQLQVGDVVLAIGNPFGVGQSVSRGIVSALSRGVGIGVIEDFIQTDAAINPGNSGGALIDTEGRVVGINTAILSRSGGFNGVGFAIPINLVRAVAEQLVATGRMERGMLGVTPQDLDEDLSAQFGTDKGVLVSDLAEDSPAGKAGLKTGDVITKINDLEIRDTRHLIITVGQMAPGTEVTVGYLRDGKPQTAKVKLARRSDAPAEEDTPEPGKDVGVLNGVTVGDLTPQLRAQFGIPERVTGAIITEIDPDSPSARQGLREGDVIAGLDRREVNDAAEAVKLSEEIKGPKVLVNIWRNGRRSFVVIDESRK
jgi:serine protease Do